MAVNYPFYTNPDLFVPSPAALKAWFSTRKNNSPFYPGVFDTVGYSGDLAWTLIALFIELLASGVTLYGGLKTSFTYAILCVVIVVLFLGLDIIGVMLHKSKQADKCIHRNSAFVSKNPPVIAKHTELASRVSITEFLGILLIVFSAALKILGLVMFFISGKSKGVVIIGLGTLLYIVVIYIHLTHTGYLISALSANRFFKREFNAWSDKLTKGQIISSPQINTITFNSAGMMIGPNPINSGRQVFTLIGSSQGINQYTLETRGLLWDQDLINLCGLLTDQILIQDLRHEATRMQFGTAGVVLP
jgi:hypothetical protein